MYRLKILSCGQEIADWPCPPDVAIPGLCQTIDTAVQMLRRWGPVAVILDTPDGMINLIGQWRGK